LFLLPSQLCALEPALAGNPVLMALALLLALAAGHELLSGHFADAFRAFSAFRRMPSKGAKRPRSEAEPSEGGLLRGLRARGD
jgi:hypothetical protein